MANPADPRMTIEAERQLPVATAQLVQFNMTTPADNVLHREDSYWLDFCLTPRPKNARARYSDHWAPRQFERIGNIFLLPAGEPLQARSDGGSPQSSLLCLMNPGSIREWFDEELQWTDQRLRASLDIRESSIRSLLLRLVDELRHPGFAGDTLIELIIAQLAIELSRYCVSVTDSGHRGGLASWRLRLIEERVRDEGEAPTLAELAELCQLSVRQLTRGFRESQGCSVGDYVARCRIEQAQALLATDSSIKAIAYTLGFSSPSSFCYAFKRSTGESPGQYRQRLQQACH